MDYTVLQNRIRTEYTGDVDLSAALDELYFSEAEDAADFPYGTFHIIANSSALTAARAALESLVIQFNLFDKGSDSGDLGDAKGKLETVFDPLVFQSGGHAYELERFFDDGPAKVQGFWQASIQYRVTIAPS